MDSKKESRVGFGDDAVFDTARWDYLYLVDRIEYFSRLHVKLLLW
jgi:hypothetical protein